jgi:site-specific DNA recombinase
MEQGRYGSMDALAEASGYGREHAMDLLCIAWLAPDITGAILEGRQPVDLTRSKLIRWPAVPL